MSISKYIQDVISTREERLTKKAQSMVPWLQASYQRKAALEEEQRRLDLERNDILSVRRGAGYSEDEISSFQDRLSGINTAEGLRQSAQLYDEEVAAKRNLSRVGAAIPANRDELMVGSSQATKGIGLRDQAKALGSEAYAVFNKSLANSGDASIAFGDAQRYVKDAETQNKRKQEMADYEIKRKQEIEDYEIKQQIKSKYAPPKTESKSETKAAEKQFLNAKVYTEEGISYVYWNAASGRKVKALVYADSQGVVRYKSGSAKGQAVQLKSMLDWGDVNKSEYVTVEPALPAKKSSAPPAKQVTTPSPAYTAGKKWDNFKV